MRPTKFTPKVVEKLILAVKAGNYRDAAAAYAGVGVSTFQMWLKRGKEQKSGPFRDMVLAIEQAEQEAEAQMVLIWRTHMKTDYRAIRDFLERRYPKRWARRETMIHVDASGGEVTPASVQDPFVKRLATNPKALSAYHDLLATLSGDEEASSV